MRRWRGALLACACLAAAATGGSVDDGAAAHTAAGRDRGTCADPTGAPAAEEAPRTGSREAAPQPAAAGDVPAALNRTFAALKKWLKAGGGRVSRHLQLYETGALRGRGLRVAPSSDGGVRKGDTLAFIPWGRAVGQSRGAEGDARALVAHALLGIMSDPARRAGYEPYLASFPDPEELLNTPPPDAEAGPCPHARVSSWADVARFLGQQEGWTSAEAWRATQLALSRSAWVGGTAYMIPLWDLVNHNVTLRNVALREVDTGVAIFATRDVPAGGELFTAYTTPVVGDDTAAAVGTGSFPPTSMQQFYDAYGFVDPVAVAGYDLEVKNRDLPQALREISGCGAHVVLPAPAAADDGAVDDGDDSDGPNASDAVPHWFVCLALCAAGPSEVPAASPAGLDAFKHRLARPGPTRNALTSSVDAALATDMFQKLKDMRGTESEACRAARVADPEGFACLDFAGHAMRTLRAAKAYVDRATRASWPATPVTAKYATLVDHVVRHGGYVTRKMFMQTTPDRGNILMMSEDHTIQKGEPIAFIPNAVIIQNERPANVLSEMLHGYMQAVTTRAGFHKPYFDVMPEEPFGVHVMSEGEQRCFGDLLALDSEATRYEPDRRVQREMMRTYNSSAAAVERAVAVVLSRGLGARTALVPVFDLCNHDANPGIKIRPSGLGYHLIAARDISRGAEVFSHYNIIPPDLFYKNWGFHINDARSINLHTLPSTVVKSAEAHAVCSDAAAALPPDGTISPEMLVCAHYTGLLMHGTMQDAPAAAAFLSGDAGSRGAAMAHAPDVAWRVLHDRLTEYLSGVAASSCGAEHLNAAASGGHARGLQGVRDALSRVAGAGLAAVEAKLRELGVGAGGGGHRDTEEDALGRAFTALAQWVETRGGYVSPRLRAVENAPGDRRVYLRRDSAFGAAPAQILARLPRAAWVTHSEPRLPVAALSVALTMMRAGDTGLAPWLAALPDALPAAFSTEEAACHADMFNLPPQEDVDAVRQLAQAQGVPEDLALRALGVVLRTQINLLGPITDVPDRCPAHLQNAAVAYVDDGAVIAATRYIAPGEEVCWFPQAYSPAVVLRTAGAVRLDGVRGIYKAFPNVPADGGMRCDAALITRDGVVSDEAVHCVLYFEGVTDPAERTRDAETHREEIVRRLALSLRPELHRLEAGGSRGCLDHLPASPVVERVVAVRALYLEVYRALMRRAGLDGPADSEEGE